MFLEKIEAAAGNPAVQQDAVVVVIIDAVLNLSVLGQVGQDASVGYARLDLGVDGTFEQGLADGLLQVFNALTPRRADGHRIAMVGLEHIQERAVGNPVGLVQHQQRGMVFQSELAREPR